MNNLLELDRLRAENAALRALLAAHGIEIPETAADVIPVESQSNPLNPKVFKRSPLSDKIALFMSLFRGRQDVYARR